MDKQLSIYVRTCNPFKLRGKFKPVTFRKYDIGGVNLRFFGISMSVNYG